MALGNEALNGILISLLMRRIDAIVLCRRVGCWMEVGAFFFSEMGTVHRRISAGDAGW